MKRTLVKQSNGGYQQVKNVDEEALDNTNIRIHTDEDQPAAIQVEDDEIVAYLDEQTGYFYDCDGMYIELGEKDDKGSLEGAEEREAYNDPAPELVQNPEDDLKSAIELMNKKKPRVRAQTAVQRSAKRIPVPSKYKIDKQPTQKQTIDNESTKTKS